MFVIQGMRFQFFTGCLPVVKGTGILSETTQLLNIIISGETHNKAKEYDTYHARLRASYSSVELGNVSVGSVSLFLVVSVPLRSFRRT